MVSFDYDSIRNRLIERLRAKESWKDILFYSTNARLIDIFAEELAYNMQMNEIYTTECKWSLAQQISSILTEVQFFNYTPHRKTGAVGSVIISSSKSFNAAHPKSIEIPKYTTFATESDISVCSTSTANLTPSLYTLEIPVVQGESKETTFIASGEENEEFLVSNAHIENSVYDVLVNNVEWNRVDSLRESSSSDSLTYKLSNLTDFSGVTLSFGDGFFSKKLSEGDVVTFKFIETLGHKGNIDSAGVVSVVKSTVYDVSSNEVDIYCKNNNAISGGSDYENIESIRSKAPKTYQAGSRVISKQDYISIIESFPFVKKANCWGESEINEDLGNLPGTFIPTEENVVRVSAINISDKTVTPEQQLLIRDELNEKKSLSDIVVFEEASFIKLKFIVNAFVSDKKYSLSLVASNIVNTLMDQYSVDRLEFKKPIRFSDYTSLIDGVEGVEYHDTTIQYYKDQLFNIAYSADLTPEVYNIKPHSFKVYVKNSLVEGSAFIQIAHDDGAGVLAAESGYTLSASSINYNTGVGSIIVETGLTENFANYIIRVYFETTVQNIIPTKRYQILSYGESVIDVEYEV